MTAVAEQAACPYCGYDHPWRACPRVKAIEFSPADGVTVTRVEFLTPADCPPAGDEPPSTGYERLPPGRVD